MKKLGKLNLKAEKMLSHEELVSFKGGGCFDTWYVCEENYQAMLYECAINCQATCPHIEIIENCYEPGG